MPVVTNIAGNRRLVRPRWGRARHARDELSRALPELPAGRARRPCTLARIGSGRRCPRPRQIADPGWNRMFRRGRSPLIPNSRSRIPIWCSSWKEVGPHFPSGNAWREGTSSASMWTGTRVPRNTGFPLMILPFNRSLVGARVERISSARAPEMCPFEKQSKNIKTVRRKLAAIFAADVAGYSRLMARDA